MSDNPHKAVQFLIDTAPLYSKAKATRMYLEEFRKSRNIVVFALCDVRHLARVDRTLSMAIV